MAVDLQATTMSGSERENRFLFLLCHWYWALSVHVITQITEGSVLENSSEILIPYAEALRKMNYRDNPATALGNKRVDSELSAFNYYESTD